MKKGDSEVIDISMDQIEESLYLGNLSAATNKESLASHHISHILTVESSPLPSSITSISGMKFLYIQVHDMSHEDLLSHFEETFDFISDGQKKGCVLVHCLFGVSRSATIVIAFLMKKYKISVQEAIEITCLRRRFIGPNCGFIMQLHIYQSLGFSFEKTNLQYQLYRIHTAASTMSRGHEFQLSAKFHDIIQLDPRSDLPAGDRISFKCRSCRSSLVNKKSLLPHHPGENTDYLDHKWWDNVNNTVPCSQGIFTLPMEWMSDIKVKIAGKLFCPNCSAKIGSFNWTAGCKCPCGTRVAPAFYLVPSKFDKC